MWWSPFVDGYQVNVEVENGIATLEGKVDTYRELNAANESAYEGGAVWVDNELNVARSTARIK
jgi:osmotically-inducible protein OsmY